MAFESVRGYVELASGLSELTRARAVEAAQGLLSLPAAGIVNGSKVAVQAASLADELLAAATANRSNLRKLVRSEVDVAITRLGLVSVQKFEDAQAEAGRLRAEVARLRSTSSSPAPAKTRPRKAAPAKKAAKKAASAPRAKKSAPAKKSASAPRANKAIPAKTAKATSRAASASRSAVTTRGKPAGT
jgi:hypothetical protein